MKRDMDYIREVLSAIETTDALPDTESESEARKLLGHLEILIDAGLLAGPSVERINMDTMHVAPGPFWLTWSGHELLSTIRSDSVWNQTKAKVSQHVGDTSVAVMIMLAKHYALEILGIGDQAGS